MISTSAAGERLRGGGAMHRRLYDGMKFHLQQLGVFGSLSNGKHCRQRSHIDGRGSNRELEFVATKPELGPQLRGHLQESRRKGIGDVLTSVLNSHRNRPIVVHCFRSLAVLELLANYDCPPFHDQIPGAGAPASGGPGCDRLLSLDLESLQFLAIRPPKLKAESVTDR